MGEACFWLIRGNPQFSSISTPRNSLTLLCHCLKCPPKKEFAARVGEICELQAAQIAAAAVWTICFNRCCIGRLAGSYPTGGIMLIVTHFLTHFALDQNCQIAEVTVMQPLLK